MTWIMWLRTMVDGRVSVPLPTLQLWDPGNRTEDELHGGNRCGWSKLLSRVLGWSSKYWIYVFLVGGFKKNISQNGNFPQIGVKIKNIWNHHLVFFLPGFPTVTDEPFRKSVTNRKSTASEKRKKPNQTWSLFLMPKGFSLVKRCFYANPI